jgi:hypothetical protein
VETAHFEAGTQPLQRMPSGDLRVTSLVFETVHADAHLLPRLRPFGFEAIETQTIHGLEWQSKLKALVRRGVELRGGPDRLLPSSFRPKALEADRTRRGPSCFTQTARAAEHSRAPALELATWQRNPFSFNSLVR